MNTMTTDREMFSPLGPRATGPQVVVLRFVGRPLLTNDLKLRASGPRSQGLTAESILFSEDF